MTEHTAKAFDLDLQELDRMVAETTQDAGS